MGVMALQITGNSTVLVVFFFYESPENSEVLKQHFWHFSQISLYQKNI